MIIITPFSDIFKIYLNIVTEDLYSLLDESDAEYNLITLLLRAVSLFEYPKVSLEYDVEQQVFIEKLNDREINLLADFMAELWLRDHLFDNRLAEAEYIDKDFSIKQQEQIKALNTLYETVRKERQYQQRMYNRHSRDGGTFKYSNLAGGVLW